VENSSAFGLGKKKKEKISQYPWKNKKCVFELNAPRADFLS
jgi:hypothetical protein